MWIGKTNTLLSRWRVNQSTMGQISDPGFSRAIQNLWEDWLEWARSEIQSNLGVDDVSNLGAPYSFAETSAFDIATQAKGSEHEETSARWALRRVRQCFKLVNSPKSHSMDVLEWAKLAKDVGAKSLEGGWKTAKALYMIWSYDDQRGQGAMRGP